MAWRGVAWRVVARVLYAYVRTLRGRIPQLLLYLTTVSRTSHHIPLFFARIGGLGVLSYSCSPLFFCPILPHAVCSTSPQTFIKKRKLGCKSSISPHISTFGPFFFTRGFPPECFSEKSGFSFFFFGPNHPRISKRERERETDSKNSKSGRNMDAQSTYEQRMAELHGHHHHSEEEEEEEEKSGEKSRLLPTSSSQTTTMMMPPLFSRRPKLPDEESLPPLPAANTKSSLLHPPPQSTSTSTPLLLLLLVLLATLCILYLVFNLWRVSLLIAEIGAEGRMYNDGGGVVVVGWEEGDEVSFSPLVYSPRYDGPI